MAKKTEKRRVITDFELTAIAAVDRPCQEGAKMAIMKVAPTETVSDKIAKFLSVADGAKPFSDFLEEKLETNDFWDKRDEVYPFTSALNASIESILVDSELDTVSKNNMLKSSIDDFMSSISSVLPDLEIEGELTEFVEKFDKSQDATATTEDSIMPDAKENFGELKKSVEELTSKLEKVEAEKATAETIAKMSDAEKAYMDGLKTKKEKDSFMAMDAEKRKMAMKKAADADEVIEVDGQEVKKSVIGDEAFALIKKNAERMDKMEQDAEIQKAEMRKAHFVSLAKSEFENLPGETDLNGRSLDAVDSIEDEEVKKHLMAILKSHNDGAFVERGGGNADMKADEKVSKAAVDAFEGKIADIQKRDDVNRLAAMEKARKEFPDEFEAYQKA